MTAIANIGRPAAYSREFYEQQRDPSLRSAEVVVPLLLELIGPRSVVDVGCGTGTWLSVLLRHGITDVLGIDGDYVSPAQLLIPSALFQARDLCRPLVVERTFDLALCLEVAEHLPPEAAATIVGSLVRLAPVVVFSAAIPFQGGTGHLNEQWQDYWAEKFAAHDFVALDPLRARIWNDPRVHFPYAQNALMFVRRERLESHPGLQRWAPPACGFPASVVHPRMYLDCVDPTRQTFRLALSHFLAVVAARARARLGGPFGK